MVGLLSPRPRAQMPGQSMGQRPGGLLGGLLDPEVALPVAAALLGNQGNAGNFGQAMAQLGSGIGDQKRLRREEGVRNQTVEMLKQQAPQIADAIANGIMSPGEGYKMFLEQRKAEKPTSMIQEYEYAKKTGAFNGTITDWATKGVKDQDATFGREAALRKEYGATPEYKRYDDVRAAYERVRTSASMDTGAGDIGTIFGYMKMLDPGSVVREGEFATAQQSSGVPDQIRNLYNRVVNGERLTPEQRAEFVRVSDGLYQNEAQRIEALNQRYGSIAGEYQLDPNRIVQQPGKYQPLEIGQVKDVGNGIKIERTR